ncbi:FecR family protein [Parapedobacter sp. ISTM3]|uniref:FecR family protein n=1 Tax=Parapedobacter sp. ISTM3 TaxID=2800130 RepID=UPI0019085902|nr:FecR family protein [Parapedobacter sp. ISTM3]MBK1439353.1 FecR family protein [Parapedobacter sp. ISTM3]
MRTGKDIEQLLVRRLQGIATDTENQQIEQWADEDVQHRATLARLDSEETLREDLRTLLFLVDTEVGVVRLKRMNEHIRRSIARRPKRRLNKWLPYVAAMVIAAATLAWWFLEKQPGHTRSDIVRAENIQPGGNRATLTLTDGRTITLDETQHGIIFRDQNISYTDGSRLLDQYEAAPTGHTGPPYVILTTPRGGTYQIVLQDGTQIWLNASSSLRYPTAFDRNERVVEITGEGYFVVAEDSRPFKVISGRQTINVLGTEFNISAYPDEPETKTTLVKGKVQIGLDNSRINHAHAPFTLRPGQQGIVDTSSVRVEWVDVSQHTAWKDGFFYFDGDSPQEAFAQLARWYDIEVVYRNDLHTIEFYGKIERNMSLGAFLSILEEAGLDFEVIAKKSGLQLVVGTE